MSKSKEVTVSKQKIPIFVLVILGLVFVTGLFVVGYDQGHLFSIVMGEEAFENMFIHELTHDMRHAAGFPCH